MIPTQEGPLCQTLCTCKVRLELDQLEIHLEDIAYVGSCIPSVKPKMNVIANPLTPLRDLPMSRRIRQSGVELISPDFGFMIA